MTTLDEAIAAAQRITRNMAGQAPYAGPERRVLDPQLTAAPATSSRADRRPIYYVRTGSALLEVDSPLEQRRIVLLHNLINGHTQAPFTDERWPSDGAR